MIQSSQVKMSKNPQIFRTLVMLGSLAIVSISGCHKGPASSTDPEEMFQMELYVSPTGSDENDGSLNAPFASLERARDAIRASKADGALAAGAVFVQLREGVYPRSASFHLTEQDGGAPEAPIVYRAYPGESVHITGGRSFSLVLFSLVTDPEVLARLPVEARGKVRQIDLKSMGTSQFDAPPLFGHGMGMLEKQTSYRTGAKASELFVNGEPMMAARWPNEGYATVEKVIEKGDVIRAWMDDAKGAKAMEHTYVPPEKRNNPPKNFSFGAAKDRLVRWKNAKDMMLLGYWYYNWSDQSVRVASVDAEAGVIHAAQPSAYGIRSGQRFYVYNLLEELDLPGEWYLDRDSGILYLFPPSEEKTAQVEFSELKVPLVLMENVSHVRFEGMELGVTRDSVFRVKGGVAVEIRGCRIGNIGGAGIQIEGGKKHAVRSSEIFNTGTGGINASGGDIKNLISGDHVFENNLIRNFARIERTYRPAIGLNGVGLRAAHNEIHDSPHSAIIFTGNNHIIECNHIYDVCKESDDAAAIYAGRSWTARGTLIQNNLIRDVTGFKQGSHRVSGVYLDDGFSGTTVRGNIFLNVAQGIFFNGGRDNHAENNLFIDNENMMRGTDMSKSFTTWAAMSWKTLNANLAATPIQGEVWRTAYPELITLTSDEPQLPKNNTVKNNLRFQTPLHLGSDGPNFAQSDVVDANQKGIEENFIRFGVVENNPETTKLPGSYDSASRHFQFYSTSGVFSMMPDLKKIPVDQIGREVR